MSPVVTILTLLSKYHIDIVHEFGVLSSKPSTSVTCADIGLRFKDPGNLHHKKDKKIIA
jgi:hypothetical protein